MFRCSRCDGVIDGKYYSAFEKKYHTKCWKCDYCDIILPDSGFYHGPNKTVLCDDHRNIGEWEFNEKEREKERTRTESIDQASHITIQIQFNNLMSGTLQIASGKSTREVGEIISDALNVKKEDRSSYGLYRTRGEGSPYEQKMKEHDLVVSDSTVLYTFKKIQPSNKELLSQF